VNRFYTWVISSGDAASAFVGRAIGYTRHANQSISGKAFEDYLKGRPLVRECVNGLFFLQKDHCYKAWLSDEKRAREEIAYKKALREKYPEHF
jgi:hypothetical protein